MEEEFEEEMEMPTPCQHCGSIFDLHDGEPSEKWYPDTVICEACSYKEEEEMDEDVRWEQINMEVANALYNLHTETAIASMLEDDNKKQIIKIAEILTKNSNQ